MSAPKLHYNKEKLESHYTSTFSRFMKALAIGVGGAVLYFFGVITFLGGWGHTHTQPYVQEFGDRIDYQYSGTKLPMYQNPALANQPAQGSSH
ncbi:MAG: hypothetical protein GC129_01075 [Proteobacteria bacterium]|nr:hypothetical protein [Pseudomonadota bacterium]